MVLVIFFTLGLPSPLMYSWGQDVYEACPLCARAHELRTCDGETKVTFQLCEDHAKA